MTQPRREEEIARLQARVATLEREARERMQADYALGREREARRRLIESEVRAHVSHQAAVAELGQQALSGVDSAALTNETVALVARTLGVELCEFQELTTEGAALVMTAAVGWSPGVVGHTTVSSALDSQAGYTLLSNEAVVVEDCATERRFRPLALFEEQGVVSSATVVVHGHDKPLGVLGVHTRRHRAFAAADVTFLQSIAHVFGSAIERRQVDEALRTSDATARAFLESAAEGIVIVDEAGRIVLINAQTERMFGYGRDDLLGRAVEVLLPEGARAAHLHHRAGYVTDPHVRQMGRDLVLAGRRRDGSEFPVEISLSYVGTPTGLLALAFITDITDRLNFQHAARQADKLAAIGTLAAGIAHEINNPIGVISSRIEIMLVEADSEPLPAHVVEDLGVLYKHAQRVARIAQGLLSFARQSVAERVPLDLNQIIEDTLFLVRSQMAKTGLTVRLALAPALPPVKGDGNALGQVVLNLLTNACDATPAGGELRIVTGRPPDGGDLVEVTVADTGVGMDADTLARIFDPFFTTKRTGTGLGLSISYGIVREHGGTFTAQSSPGAGTTFAIRLPASAD